MGFSPLVAHLMPKSNIIQEMRRKSEENYKFNKLLELLLHETEGNVVLHENLVQTIVITKLELDFHRNIDISSLNIKWKRI